MRFTLPAFTSVHVRLAFCSRIAAVQLLTLIERKDEQACSGSDPTGLAKVKTRVFAGALCACQRAACLY